MINIETRETLTYRLRKLRDISRITAVREYKLSEERNPL